jgi:hypothetical protein
VLPKINKKLLFFLGTEYFILLGEEIILSKFKSFMKVTSKYKLERKKSAGKKDTGRNEVCF